MGMNKNLKVSFGAIALLGMAACSHAPTAKFDKITPGMSESQVKNEMDAGPTRFEKVGDTDYTSWYWGKDYCVLFKADKVVAKDQTEAGRSVSVGPGKYEEKKSAQCLAPGQTASNGSDRIVNIPGIGTIQLPKSQIQNGS